MFYRIVFIENKFWILSLPKPGDVIIFDSCLIFVQLASKVIRKACARARVRLNIITVKHNNWIDISIPSCRAISRGMQEAGWCPFEGGPLISRGQVAILGLPGMRHPPLLQRVNRTSFIRAIGSGGRGREERKRNEFKPRETGQLTIFQTSCFGRCELWKYNRDLCIHRSRSWFMQHSQPFLLTANEDEEQTKSNDSSI